MTRYVDGFIVAVKNDRLEDYRKLSAAAGAVWREHGALQYIECVADDVSPGKLTSFPRAVLLEPDETVVFAWIIYDLREQRDRVNAKVHEDPRLAAMFDPSNMPFDGKRMIFGGFRELVNV